MGFLDLDLPCDIRDIIADVRNLAKADDIKWDMIAMLGLDLIGVIPVIGALKYSDEIGTLFKNADKVSVVARSTDGAGVLAKHADEAGAWLQGVKVFRYSDETAEAVASGEKLLKESQTVYESFADMMSPDDAAKYLDFLENGSKEGLTSAELADALLVSQKVGSEDVWDLRNAGDALESGSSTIHNDILDSPRTGSALKVDDVNPIYKINEKTGKRQIVKEFPATAQSHGFNDIVDNYAGYATQTPLNNATLYQLDGSLNGVAGRFEWIIQDGNVTHRMFIQNGTMNGVPIKS